MADKGLWLTQGDKTPWVLASFFVNCKMIAHILLFTSFPRVVVWL